MKEWLAETHGPKFELFRHFLLRFFESDLITTPGSMAGPIAGAVGLLIPWFPLFAQPLRGKYKLLSHLPVPGPYRLAVRADELWLITLMMSAAGLLAAIRWQSLFPSLRDYRALGALPLRARQIFAAKLLALVAVASGAIFLLNILPAVTFPFVSKGRWQINPSFGAHLAVHAAACVAACYFFVFAQVALQGVLLNLLPPRAFGRLTGHIQGLLVATMLILLVLSFSIEPGIARALARPEIGRWLPPVWFLGLYQTMLGDPDPVMHALARYAIWGLGTAVALTLLSYQVSYHRHRTLLVEGARGAARDRRLNAPGALLDLLIPNPRQQAVIVFTAKTLARSSQHRMILMGYAGFGAAVLLSGIIGLTNILESRDTAAACFVSGHVILLAFLLIGLRHLFSLPTELRANWIFQMTELEGRAEWLRAVDRFVLSCGSVLMILLPLPFELRLLGPRALAEVVLFLPLALLCYERSFSGWEKLPFTCSYLPGKTPMWTKALELLGLLIAFPVAGKLLTEGLQHPPVFGILFAILVAGWLAMRANRREAWGDLRLKYDEGPDPAVLELHLMA